ncbi:MAG: NADH-quinone oxidoreductase subunit K [Deltaproteobacteria bacterium]|nr:NADH-quinone oxidoreductase subunit K [Deltaproteobacteria bacterium]
MLPVVALAVLLLITVGVFLLLHKSLLRVALGLGCLSHAVHFLVLSSGRWGDRAPLVRDGVRPEDIGDPVSQAFVLTAIVIAMAFTLYLLAGMAAQTRRGGAPELAPPPDGDAERAADEILAELEGRGTGS